MIWKITLDEKPDPNDGNRANARLAFQGMWVAGTLGVFFVALISNLPTHLAQLGCSTSCKYPLQVLLSYGYLLWFLSYFFVSNLRNIILKEAGIRDLIFDVIQSIAAFYAVYQMGFIALNLNFDFKSYAHANGSIFVICVLSLILFGCKSKTGINIIRGYGALISAVSFMFVKYVSTTPKYSELLWTYIVLAVLLILSWVVLWPFIILCIDEKKPNGQK